MRSRAVSLPRWCWLSICPGPASLEGFNPHILQGSQIILNGGLWIFFYGHGFIFGGKRFFSGRFLSHGLSLYIFLEVLPDMDYPVKNSVI